MAACLQLANVQIVPEQQLLALALAQRGLHLDVAAVFGEELKVPLLHCRPPLWKRYEGICKPSAWILSGPT